jgi:4-alpha-glucanotransferase
MSAAVRNVHTPAARQAGVCLHVASLPGPHGIGEIGAPARNFIDTMRRLQLGVWQFLPLGPTGYGDSPYQSLSTFAGNEMLIDVGELVEMGLLDEDEVEELTALPRDYVDYGNLIPAKNRLLDIAARRFAQRADESLQKRCSDFLRATDAEWLHDYALFRILKTRHHERPWPEWPAKFVHRDPGALQALESSAAQQIRTIKIIQFLFFYQWQQLRDYAHQNHVTLFGDMPIYIALDSADAWANRDLLCLDENGRPDHVAGVPPDYFSEDGQLWGNPLYDWEKHAASGYGWWIKRLRAAAELVDIVRIDHFRGFESYWSVPADAGTARIGEWVPGPRDAIFIAIRKALGDLPIVAEDLGVITPEVEALRDQHDLPGMRVLQFDVCDQGFDLGDVAENSVCYTGTHDNDTTIGWFKGSPHDIRSDAEIKLAQEAVLKVTAGSQETISIDLIRAAFSTRAHLAIAPMQDFLGLGSEARINTPGTAGGNWRWRMLDSQVTARLCDDTAALVRASGRELDACGRSQAGGIAVSAPLHEA